MTARPNPVAALPIYRDPPCRVTQLVIDARPCLADRVAMLACHDRGSLLSRTYGYYSGRFRRPDRAPYPVGTHCPRLVAGRAAGAEAVGGLLRGRSAVGGECARAADGSAPLSTPTPSTMRLFLLLAALATARAQPAMCGYASDPACVGRGGHFRPMRLQGPSFHRLPRPPAAALAPQRMPTHPIPPFCTAKSTWAATRSRRREPTRRPTAAPSAPRRPTPSAWGERER